MITIAYLVSALFISPLRAEDILKIKFPASYVQTKELADEVCLDLFYSDWEKKTACMKNFLFHMRKLPESPPPLVVKCRSEDMITFAVTPSEDSQLATLVDADDITSPINYSILKPNENYGRIYIGPGNYTLWSTTLDDAGRPSAWRQGPLVESWKELQNNIENKPYDVKITYLFESYENNTYFIDAEFAWNSTDDSDSCFDVLNHCNKKTQGDVFRKKVKPNENRTVTVTDLPLDDTCSFVVSGKYGTSKRSYSTPRCDLLPGCAPLPEVPLDVTMQALPDVNNTWRMRVRWSPPSLAPLSYNVTLRAAQVYTSVVPGNETEAQFEGVEGEWEGDGQGQYNVSVAARTASGTAVTSRRGAFTTPTGVGAGAGALAGAAWSLALLGAAALLLAALCWRRRRHHPIYFPETAEKIDEDAIIIDVGGGAGGGAGSGGGGDDQWELRPERLRLHEVLGEGAFGVVRRGTLAPANKDVAVKMLKDFPSVEEVRSFRAEMELMKSVGAHPHVVSLLGCCSGRRPLIVAEYCGRGDLLSYLRCAWDMMISRRNIKYYNNNDEGMNYRNDLFKSKPPEQRFVANRLYDFEGVCDTELTLLDLISFCRQIAMGMEFLASNRVVHRDLAARNILVTSDRTLKIADFGLSRDIYQENQYKQKGNGKMPVKWMALESLTHRLYTTQSDVWSFGVVVWEVVTLGGAPYAGVSAARLPRLLAAGYRMPRPPNCTPPLYEVMLSCWSERPRCRPTFSELHARLDELLCACADHYLSLELPPAPPTPAPPSPARYVRMLLSLKRARSSNHYTAQPASPVTPTPALLHT